MTNKTREMRHMMFKKNYWGQNRDERKLDRKKEIIAGKKREEKKTEQRNKKKT